MAHSRKTQGHTFPKTPGIDAVSHARRRPDDVVLQYLRSLPEMTLHTEIMKPLLHEIASHVVYVHGPNERGKDFVYVTSDPYGDSTLEVCQVKNAPFHGRSGDGSTSSILDQMVKCRTTEVLNPKTNRKERPQVVSLWTTYAIPDRDTGDSHRLLEELREQRCKVLGPEKILSLLKEHLPEKYQQLAYPGEGIRNALRIYLQTHHEAVAFETQRIRVLSDFFVDMGLAHHAFGCVGAGSPRSDRTSSEIRIPASVYRTVMDLYESLPVTIRKQFIEVSHAESPRLNGGKLEEPLVRVKALHLNDYSRAVQKEIERLQTSGKAEDIARAVELMFGCGYLITWVPSIKVAGTGGGNCSECLGDKFPLERPAQLNMPDIPPEGLLAARDNICVVGEAGAGKTCLARMLALTAFDRGLDCVYFPCSRLASKDKSLPTAMQDFLTEISGGKDGSEARRYIESATLIILDGADEATTFASTLGEQVQLLAFGEPIRVKATSQVSANLAVPIDMNTSLWAAPPYIEFSVDSPIRRSEFDRLRRINSSAGARRALDKAESLYLRNGKRVVVTTRATEQPFLGRAFTQFAVRPFSDSQMSEFFSRWFAEEPQNTNEVLSFLDNNPNVREICRLPIIATIVAVIKEHGYDLPHSKTEVYSQRFSLLLERWDAAKHVPRRTRIRPADKMMLLMRVALSLHVQHQRTFAHNEFRAIWREGFKRIYPAILPDEVLQELVVANSLVYAHSDDQFSLGHLSFQEFLTARALMHGPSHDILVANFHDPWWRDVIVFYAGLVGDITSLMKVVQKKYALSADKGLLSQMMDEARFTKGVVRDFVIDAIADGALDYEEWDGGGSGATS